MVDQQVIPEPDLSPETLDPRGYRAYWKRVAKHIRLSEAGKALGVRSRELSALERGKPQSLDDEMIEAYLLWLENEPARPGD